MFIVESSTPGRQGSTASGNHAPPCVWDVRAGHFHAHRAPDLARKQCLCWVRAVCAGRDSVC
jgi:hypothetical protein